uniref:Uncharacterized protein n=1 Tax=Panagrellus redivivus TaxID=6233 RepID=A0A7E4US76_PANRE
MHPQSSRNKHTSPVHRDARQAEAKKRKMPRVCIKPASNEINHSPMALGIAIGRVPVKCMKPLRPALV